MPRRTEPQSPTPETAKLIADALMAPKQEDMGLRDQVRRKVQMPLDVELKDEDILKLANEFADLDSELAKHRKHASEVKSDLKETEDTLESKVSEIGKKIRARKELRVVDVEQVVDYASNSYFEVRTDTQEELPGTRRALSPLEMQREFPLTPEERRRNDFAEVVKDAQESELRGAPRLVEHEPDEEEMDDDA